MSNPIKSPSLLTPQVVQNLIEAHQKLVELLNKKVIEKGDDQERAGLGNFIGNTMLEHAPELLAAWQTVQFEYAPLARAVARFADRVLGVQAALAGSRKEKDNAKA